MQGLVTSTLVVPTAFMPNVIGASGEMLAAIKRASGADVTVKTQGSPSPSDFLVK